MKTEQLISEEDAIEALRQHAIAHEKGGDECSGNRSRLVAELMDALGMGLLDLGFIAEAWLELPVPSDVPQDNVLDATEICSTPHDE